MRARTVSHLPARGRPTGRRLAMESRPTEEQDFLAALGRRVRHVRALRGMSRKVLARVSGISERYIAQLESGQGNVSIKLLRRGAAARGGGGAGPSGDGAAAPGGRGFCALLRSAPPPGGAAARARLGGAVPPAPAR